MRPAELRRPQEDTPHTAPLTGTCPCPPAAGTDQRPPSNTHFNNIFSPVLMSNKQEITWKIKRVKVAKPPYFSPPHFQNLSLFYV